MNLFSEDALIEQPAIRLFKDVLEPSTNKTTNSRMDGWRSSIREKFVDGSCAKRTTCFCPRLVSGEIEVEGIENA